MKRESVELEICRLEEELARAPSQAPGAPGGAPSGPSWLGPALALTVTSVLAALLVGLPVRAGVEASPMIDAGFRFAIALAHLPVICAFLFLRFKWFGPPWSGTLPRSPIAREVWKQLLRGMTWLCLSWLALYAWLAAAWSGVDLFGAWVRGPKGLAVADLLNTGGTLAFFYLYLVLDKPSVPIAGDPQRHRDFKRSLLVAGGVCGAVGLLSLLGRLGYLHLNELGPLCGSFAAAIAMMYFFGQFDYRYMKVKRWMIAPLYLYVAIQVAWTEIAAAGSQGWHPNTLLVAALVLKVYLFSMLVFWIREKTLQKYLDFAAL